MVRDFCRGLALAITLVALCSKSTAADVRFSSDIAPLLIDHCLACHGPKKAEGGYRVDTFDEFLKSGDSGASPIARDAGDEHELIRRFTTDDADERMPAETSPLADSEIELFQQWIDAGAEFDGSDSSLPLHLVLPSESYPAAPSKYRKPTPANAVLFSPDANQVIAGGYHELLVWTLGDDSPPRRIGNMMQRIYALKWLADGKTLAVAGGEPGRSGEVRLIDFESGEVKAVSSRTTDVMLDIAVRPQADEIAVGGADGMLRVLGTGDLTEKRSMASHADWVTAVAWSPDGTRLGSASRDKSVKVHDGVSGELLVSYQGHGASVRGLAFSADGAEILSVGADNHIHRWKVADGGKVAAVGLGAEGYQVVLRGDYAIVPLSNKNLIRFSLASNTVSQTLAGHQDWVISAAIDRSAERFASGAMNGEIRIWNPGDAAVQKTWMCQP
jgi:hypothetical protein